MINTNNNESNASALVFRPSFDLPKLSLFESDDYLNLVSQYQMLYRENEDPKAIFYNYLNVSLTYKDIDALYKHNVITPSVMIFMINYLHNEEALRGEMKPQAFIQPFRVHDWKKEIYDAMEEWCEYLEVSEFSKKQHKFLCEVIQLNNRWVLMIANLRKKSAVIVDFKYDELFPLQLILTVFTTITTKTYGIDISAFSIEGVLFSAPEQNDGGYYIINYLWKFINGAQFDRIKFSKTERSFLQQNLLWLILKLRQLKPSIEVNLSESMSQSKYSSHVSKRQQLFSQSSGKKYMKIVQAVIRKQEMGVQTPGFMMGAIPKLLPRVDTFRDWDFEPMHKPVIEEFGNKIADMIGMLDDKYKMRLLQNNSNEYKFLLQMLEDKINAVEKRKKIQDNRSNSTYKRNYAKSEESNASNDNENGFSGFESIVKESISLARQGQQYDSEDVQSRDDQDKVNLLLNYPNSESQIYQPSIVASQPNTFNKNNQNMNNQSTVLDKLNIDQSMIKSLADIEEEQDQIHPFEEVISPEENSRRIKADFEDVSNASIYGISQEVTDTTINIERNLAGGKFNAFLNHYDHSKNYLEQYNLYYNPKKYLELDREMEKLKISMNQNNLEFKMLLEAQANPNQDGLTKARKNMRDMTVTSMSFSKSQILQDIDKSIQNESHLQLPVNQSSIFRDKNVSIFSKNSMEILGYPKNNSVYCNDYHPTEQSQYSKLLNKKPTDFRMQPDQPVQKIKFNQNLQIVKSQSQMLQNIGKQSLEMRKGGDGAAIGVEDILFQKQLQEKKFKREANASDKPSVIQMLENPFKINVSYAMMMQMLQTDFISEEITNFCVSFFQKKSDARKLEAYKFVSAKKFLLLPTDFYFVLTYDVRNKKDSMSAETILEKVDQLNFTMCRPYYETQGNIFENFDFITIPLCLKHYKESTNDLRYEYWLVVVDLNERMLRLFVFSRDNPATQELYLSQVLTNVMRWLEFEYQWVNMHNFDAYKWRVVKGQTSTTPEIPKTGFYMIHCLSQLILGFSKCENVTAQTIDNVKKNIASTLVKVANNYSATQQPITDFLSYPL